MRGHSSDHDKARLERLRALLNRGSRLKQPSNRARVRARALWQSRPRKNKFSRRMLGGAALVLALLIGLGNLGVVAAQSSVPGETLYPVKRVWEQAELAVAFDSAARTEIYLGRARTRLAETRTLLNRGDEKFTGQLLTEYRQEIDRTLTGLNQLANHDAPAAAILIPRARDAARQNISVLRELENKTPPQFKPAVVLAVTDSLEIVHTELPPAVVVNQTATFTPTPTVTATRTATMRPTFSVTAPPTATPTPGISPPPTLIASSTPTPTNTIVPTTTATATPTFAPATVTPTNTAVTPVVTPTTTLGASPAPTQATETLTVTPFPTNTPAPTATPVPTETLVPTETPAPTETLVLTDTPEPTETPAPTEIPAPTETPTATETPEPTETLAPTETPTSGSPAPEEIETPAPTEIDAPDEPAAPTQTPTEPSDDE